MRPSRRASAAALVCIAATIGCAGGRSAGNAAPDSSRAVMSASNGAVAVRDTAASAGGAQAGDAVEFFPAATLERAADAMAGGSKTGDVLRSRGDFQYVVVRRVSSGVPEIHDAWADVVVVQSGRGTLLTGGHVTGSAVESPGEHRGGTIAGGASRPIGPGDLVMIPAGVPHQYEIARGDSLRYITVKVRQGRR